MIFALALTGPTASGKTALSLEIADRLGCEIISCDSMQIYRDMNIGTAKATEDERARVPHHLVDFLSLSESFSAEDYRALAVKAAKDISARGKIPLFVGGTGLYIDTVMRGVSEAPPSSEEYRKKLLDLASSEEGASALYDRLVRVDPESASAIHRNNVKRVIGALEIYDLTGKPKSYFDKRSLSAVSEVKVKMITLDFHERDNLYRRVDERVDVMMSEGLLSEVRELYSSGLLKKDTTAAAAIGYKEIISHLDGEITLDEAVELIKLSSRRYAKRQLTWFRHETDAYRMYLDNEDGTMKNKDELISEAVNIASQITKECREHV